MPEEPTDREDLAGKIGVKERRRIRAREERDVMFWLGMFGLVGWSVALPTVALTALGVWIDSKDLSKYSWTLMLLFVGTVLGCLNAWYWIKRETRDPEE